MARDCRSVSTVPVDPRTDGVEIERAALVGDISKRRRRNLVVHWYGNVPDLARLRVFVPQLKMALRAVDRIIAVALTEDSETTVLSEN